MSILTRPQGRIPIGYAVVQGERVPVVVDLEWDRYFSVLTERAGGVSGASTTELVESAYEDAGINEMQALISANEQAQSQRPIAEPVQLESFSNTAELMERITALESEVQALKQGALI